MGAVLHHTSSERTPADRGRALGAALEDPIVATADVYRRLFGLRLGTCGTDMTRLGGEAMAAIGAWAPALADEIEGIADGCGLPVEAVAALNARTEILAANGHGGRGECTTVACTAEAAAGGRALGAQTWDWLEQIGPLWFVWTIEHPDGRVVHTLTEPGIVGKIGVASGGVGVLLNILRHRDDRAPVGTPVHVACRRVLDEATTVGEALALLRSMRPSASSCLTVADAATVACAEVSPAGLGLRLPNERGVVAHTNHLVAEPGRDGDLEAAAYPDTLARLDAVERALADVEPGAIADETLVDVLAAHGCGNEHVCMHSRPGAAFGEGWATLATVVCDPGRGRLRVAAGGPRHLADGEDWDSADSTAAAPARHSDSRQGAAAS